MMCDRCITYKRQIGNRLVPCQNSATIGCPSKGTPSIWTAGRRAGRSASNIASHLLAGRMDGVPNLQNGFSNDERDMMMTLVFNELAKTSWTVQDFRQNLGGFGFSSLPMKGLEVR